MQNTKLVVTATLCLTSGGVRILTKNSYPASTGTRVLGVWSKHNYFNFL